MQVRKALKVFRDYMPDHDNRFFIKRYGKETFTDGETSLSYSMNDFWSWS